MASRENEADRRPPSPPAVACGPSGAIVLGTVFTPISSKVWLNVTVAGTVTFRMLDGNTLSQAFPVGLFALDIQCDTISLGTATATASALANVS